METKDFEPSPEQQRVIAHKDGHLQVVACAGSGKTEAISRRIAELIVVRGVSPASIVAFTFTERAAAAMKARILQRVASRLGTAHLDKLSPMYIGTIHAYCMRMLQDYVPQYANYDVLDENRHAGLLSREHKRLKLERIGPAHWAPIHDFLHNVNVVENELIKPSKLKDTPFGECYEDYCAMLRRYHFLTFGQLIKSAVEALGEPEIFQRVHGPLRYLFVDEYQDVNPAQERLIERLAKPPVQLCVVGDDDQAIYGWRGSNVGNMLSFKERYGAKTLPLSVNRRSRPRIIQAANGFSTSIKPRLSKKMEEYREAGPPEVHCWAADRAEDEAGVIAQTIRNLVDNRGYRYRDIAILLRSVRTSSPPILQALKDKNIPLRCAGRTGLFLQPEAQALGKTYAWLADNQWKPDKYGKAEDIDRDTLVAEYAAVFDLTGEAKKKLATHLDQWHARAASDDDPANLVRDLYVLLRLLGVHKWDLGDPEIAARMGCLARFTELLADFEHVRRRARWVKEDGEDVFRGGQSRGTWYYRGLHNYTQYYALDTYEDFGGEETLDLDAVDILTVHKAKGLEWPVVFVPCLVDSRFPASQTGREQDWLLSKTAFPEASRRRYQGSETDERRLFYVAMTRARDMLYLSWFQRKKNRFSPSPFLQEVAGGDPVRATKPLPLPPPFKPGEDAAADKPAMSFSELAAYEDCPLSYRLSSLLGFQPQLVAELGYGRAIHHILRRIADWVRAKNKLPDKARIDKIFQDEFYLPFAHRAAYEKLREAADKLVGRYLKHYSEDLFRIWQTERPFELHLDNGVVSGRADVILDGEGGTAGSLALVDYKTATALTERDVSAFQLAVYTAAGLGEGINIRGAYLHDLATGERLAVPVLDQAQAAKARANDLVKQIVARQFDAKPVKEKCSHCDVRFVCHHGPAR